MITNRLGALFHIENENTSGLGSAIASGRFDNVGTFRKAAGTGTSIIANGLGFNNYGHVDIRSGILAANGGYLSSSNAILKIALGGTNVGTTYGQLKVSGTVSLNGTLEVDFTNAFTPSLNDSFSVITAGARNDAVVNFFYPSNAATMQLGNTPNSVIACVSDIPVPASSPKLLEPEFIGANLKLSWTAISNLTYR